MNPVFLDFNSTTPVDERVLAAMLPYFTTHFGNASSSTHAFGWFAAEAVQESRKKVADLLGCLEQEIVFTSGSTEALNIAIKGVWENYSSKGKRIVTISTEHKAVLDTCHSLEKRGAEVVSLGVDANGIPDIEALAAAVDDKTILVCVMLANNETGLITDMRTIADIVHRKGSILLSDTTQAIGKIPVKVNDLGIDLCCVSSHKIYGPKGAGALFIRRKDPRVTLSPLIQGGGHEKGLRSGSLNVPGIVGLGEACRISGFESINESGRVKKLRDKLEKKICTLDGIRVNCSSAERLYNTSCITIKSIKADELITRLKGYAIATGSACTSAIPKPSHVLSAMGINETDAYSTIRISLGKDTLEEEAEGLTKALSAAITHLRKGN